MPVGKYCSPDDWAVLDPNTLSEQEIATLQDVSRRAFAQATKAGDKNCCPATKAVRNEYVVYCPTEIYAWQSVDGLAYAPPFSFQDNYLPFNYQVCNELCPPEVFLRASVVYVLHRLKSMPPYRQRSFYPHRM